VGFENGGREMKPVFYGILIGALGIILVVASKSKSDPLPPGTVFDKIVDVRTAAEFQEDQVAGALHIDVLDSSFQEKITKLDPEKTYAVYCRSGARSSNAQSIMKKLGFKKVINLGSLEQAKKSLNRKEK
jgi:rhodanese-related sulfurtransferase